MYRRFAHAAGSHHRYLDDGFRRGKIVARRLKEVLGRARWTAHQRPRRTDAELTAGWGVDNPTDEWDPNISRSN